MVDGFKLCLKYDHSGMICMSPENHKDKWFVNMRYFHKHYEVNE